MKSNPDLPIRAHFFKRLLQFFLTLAILSLGLVNAAPPDLTSGGVPDPAAAENTNLGATGLRGWVYHVKQDSGESRQILVEEVDVGSPADGTILVGDVILGANGTGGTATAFTDDARKSLALAIADAEELTPATLDLLVWRGGSTANYQITLATMGAYSATAPYNCPKSAKILDEGIDHYFNNEDSGRYRFGAMALLAANDPSDPDNAARMAQAQTEAHALIPDAATMTQMMSDVQDTTSTKICWERGHSLIFLAEYYLVTADATVLPAIEAYAVNIAKNQSLFGTMGHKYADKNLDGSNNGPMGGTYGAVNSAAMPCFLGMLLAKECNLSNPTSVGLIEDAIDDCSRFYAYYAGKGAIPYGEHSPYQTGHETNGKSGLAALAFALQPSTRSSEGAFFSKMATASADEREIGHTGAYFNYLWAPLGAAMGGEEAASAHFDRIKWRLDLNRNWDGGFDYDCLNGEGPDSGSEYNNFRMSTAALLTYALPLRQLHLTGRGQNPAQPSLTSTDVSEALTANDYDASSRSKSELISDLGSWSPKVWNAAAAQLATLSLSSADITQITALANDTNGDSRAGACKALGEINDGSTENSRAATLAALLTDADNLVRYMAAESMRYLPNSANESVLDTILAAADSTAAPLFPMNEEDPLHFAHNRICMLLFYSGTASGPKGVIWGDKIGDPATGTDRNLLYPAIEAVAATPGGRARGTLKDTYRNLALSDVQALAPAIVESIRVRAPADKMFSSGVRQGGIEILQQYGYAEGVPLSMIYMEDDGRNTKRREALPVLEQYAGSSLSVLPDPDVVGFCEFLVATNPSVAAEAQAVLDAIAADSNPVALTPFKSIQSVTADHPALTLPSDSTVLRVAATDLAEGDSVYTWRKVEGTGNVTFTPNGTGASADTTIKIDPVPGHYTFEVTMSDSLGLTEVTDTVSFSLYDNGGGLPTAPPAADAQSVTVSQDTPEAITLTGSDPEGYPLVFAVTTQPANGTLSGVAPSLTYTPDPGYTGADSFVFEVTDSVGSVASATVSITVEALGFITPTGVTSVSEYTGGAGAPVIRLIDGSGLSENSAAGTHDNHEFAESMYMSNGAIAGNVANEEIVFDLGANYDLSKAYVWQMNQSHAVNAGGARNTRTMNILVSSDNVNFTQIGSTVTLATADGSNSALPAEVLSLAASNVRYVKFDLLTAGSGNASEYCGLSEVRFGGDAASGAPPAGPPVVIFSEDFESTGVADGAFTSDWTNTAFASINGSGKSNLLNPTGTGNAWLSPVPAELGETFAVLHSEGIERADLVDTFAADTTYTLTFTQFARDDVADETITARLLTTGGTQLASETFAAVGTKDTYVTRTLVYTTPASGAPVGDAIRIEFADTVANSNPPQVGIDNIQLEAVGAGDFTPPTLASSDIVDNQGGSNVERNTLATYTVTFNEDMDEGTVDSSDFSNAGTAAVFIGLVTETSPGVFAVHVTPTTTGTLQLQVSAGADLTDAAGNALDTASTIADDTSLTVVPLTVTVPDVLGQSQSSAGTSITAVMLTVGNVTTAYSNTVPVGDVVSQSPAGNTSATEGSSVDLVISLGVEMATVPNVVGLPQATAESNITGANLTVGTVTSEYSPTVPAGDVISQGLTAGSSVPPSSAVDLVVSLGVDASPKLVRTTVNAVSSASWTTVNLGQTYNSPVIVATPIYPTAGLPPVVTRITNVTSTGFDIKIDRADGQTGAVSFDVSVIAVDEGVYTQATDGVTMEAVKYTSTVTANANSWVAEARTFQNTYTSPVVVGQVMSANDANWSVFWSMGSSRTNPVNASNLNVGKHVGEDPNTTRANETIGYIVIEAGSGTIDGVAYEAALGADTVKGFGNTSNPYTYSLSGGLSSTSAAAASISGMDGGNGGWAVLSGSPAFSTTSIGFHACEDQVGDSEQKHNTTQVGYIVFE